MDMYDASDRITVFPANYCHRNLLFVIHLTHVLNEPENLTGITPFIVVETNQFEEMRVHLYSLTNIKNRCVRLSDKVGRYHLIIHKIQNVCQIGSGSLADFLANAAPVVDGIRFPNTERPVLQSFRLLQGQR